MDIDYLNSTLALISDRISSLKFRYVIHSDVKRLRKWVGKVNTIDLRSETEWKFWAMSKSFLENAIVIIDRKDVNLFVRLGFENVATARNLGASEVNGIRRWLLRRFNRTIWYGAGPESVIAGIGTGVRTLLVDLPNSQNGPRLDIWFKDTEINTSTIIPYSTDESGSCLVPRTQKESLQVSTLSGNPVRNVKILEVDNVTADASSDVFFLPDDFPKLIVIPRFIPLEAIRLPRFINGFLIERVVDLSSFLKMVDSDESENLDLISSIFVCSDDQALINLKRIGVNFRSLVLDESLSISVPVGDTFVSRNLLSTITVYTTDEFMNGSWLKRLFRGFESSLTNPRLRISVRRPFQSTSMNNDSCRLRSVVQGFMYRCEYNFLFNSGDGSSLVTYDFYKNSDINIQTFGPITSLISSNHVSISPKTMVDIFKLSKIKIKDLFKKVEEDGIEMFFFFDDKNFSTKDYEERQNLIDDLLDNLPKKILRNVHIVISYCDRIGVPLVLRFKYNFWPICLPYTDPFSDMFGIMFDFRQEYILRMGQSFHSLKKTDLTSILMQSRQIKLNYGEYSDFYLTGLFLSFGIITDVLANFKTNRSKTYSNHKTDDGPLRIGFFSLSNKLNSKAEFLDALRGSSTIMTVPYRRVGIGSVTEVNFGRTSNDWSITFLDEVMHDLDIIPLIALSAHAEIPVQYNALTLRTVVTNRQMLMNDEQRDDILSTQMVKVISGVIASLYSLEQITTSYIIRERILRETYKDVVARIEEITGIKITIDLMLKEKRTEEGRMGDFLIDGVVTSVSGHLIYIILGSIAGIPYGIRRYLKEIVYFATTGKGGESLRRIPTDNRNSTKIELNYVSSIEKNLPWHWGIDLILAVLCIPDLLTAMGVVFSVEDGERLASALKQVESEIYHIMVANPVLVSPVFNIEPLGIIEEYDSIIDIIDVISNSTIDDDFKTVIWIETDDVTSDTAVLAATSRLQRFLYLTGRRVKMMTGQTMPSMAHGVKILHIVVLG